MYWTERRERVHWQMKPSTCALAPLISISLPVCSPNHVALCVCSLALEDKRHSRAIQAPSLWLSNYLSASPPFHHSLCLSLSQINNSRSRFSALLQWSLIIYRLCVRHSAIICDRSTSKIEAKGSSSANWLCHHRWLRHEHGNNEWRSKAIISIVKCNHSLLPPREPSSWSKASCNMFFPLNEKVRQLNLDIMADWFNQDIKPTLIDCELGNSGGWNHFFLMGRGASLVSNWLLGKIFFTTKRIHINDRHHCLSSFSDINWSRFVAESLWMISSASLKSIKAVPPNFSPSSLSFLMSAIIVALTWGKASCSRLP